MTKNMEDVDRLAEEILNLSRNILIINLRFMAKAISMLKYRSSSEFDGFAVDGENIYYSPIAVLKSFAEESAMMTRQYLHMVLHCIYQHFLVDTAADQDCWNLACDIAVEYTINDIAIEAVKTRRVERQLILIKTLKPKVKYMTADMLYHYFTTTGISTVEIETMRELFSSDTHDAWYSPGLKEEHWSRQEKGRNESTNRGDRLEWQDCASHSHEEIAGAVAFSQILLEEKKKTYLEWRDIARQMKMDLDIFLKEKGSGTVGLSQNLMAVTREKYDYASFLKKFTAFGEQTKINEDEFDYIFYTYGLRLYDRIALIEPLEYKDAKKVRELVIAIDTSGSTSGNLVQMFIQKTYNILKEDSFFSRFNLHIIQCDSEIQEDAKITNQKEFDEYLAGMKIFGLGGTDFRPVFSYVDKLIENHEFTDLKGLIYFTDGFGIFPSLKPHYDVAFVYVEEGYENPEVPAWAIKIVLHPDDIREI